MSEPTRDEIKQAAEGIVVTHDNHVRWDIKDFYCGERSTAAKVARAYLALREQVETVTLPALRDLVACHDEDEGMDAFGDDESVGTEEGKDGVRKDLKLTFGILRRARAVLRQLAEEL